MIKIFSYSQYVLMKARGWDIKVLSARDDEAIVVLKRKEVR